MSGNSIISSPDYELFFHSSFDLLAVFDRQGRFITVNKSWERVLGYTAEELEGEEFFRFVHPDDLAATADKFQEILSKKLDEGFINRYRTKSGEYRYFEWKVTILKTVQYCSVRDVTDRVAAKNILTESERYYRRLFEEHRAIQLLVDPVTQDIVDANQAAAQFYGWSREELKTMKITQIALASPEEIREYMNKILCGDLSCCEIQHRRADGTVRDMQILGTNIERNGKTYIQPVLIDITDRNQAQQLVTRQNEELNKLLSERDKLFSIIAHDLKSPFHGLLGFSEVLADAVKEADIETMLNLGERFRPMIKRVYDLLENLLEWAILQRKEYVFNPQNILLAKTFGDIVPLYNQIIEEKKIIVINNIPDGLRAVADPHMFNSAIRNLFHNALKFTPQFGKIELNAIVSDGQIEISVRDSGIGIPKSIADNLFTMEKEIKRKGTNGEPSSGLGLLLVKEYIEKNGGTLRFETEEQKGTTFYFTIPAVS